MNVKFVIKAHKRTIKSLLEDFSGTRILRVLSNCELVAIKVYMPLSTRSETVFGSAYIESTLKVITGRKAIIKTYFVSGFKYVLLQM